MSLASYQTAPPRIVKVVSFGGIGTARNRFLSIYPIPILSITDLFSYSSFLFLDSACKTLEVTKVTLHSLIIYFGEVLMVRVQGLEP